MTEICTECKRRRVSGLRVWSQASGRLGRLKASRESCTARTLLPKAESDRNPEKAFAAAEHVEHCPAEKQENHVATGPLRDWFRASRVDGLPFLLLIFSRKLQRRVLRQIASPIEHSITQHNITPQQDTPQQDPPQHHTPQQDIRRSKTPHLQTGLYVVFLLYS